MLSKEKFYGLGLYLPASPVQLYRVPARTLNLNAVSSSFRLPSRTGLRTGGPYFYLINPSGSAKTVLDETGAAWKTVAANTVVTVLLGTTKWFGFSTALGTAKAFHNAGAPERTVAVGFVPDASAPTTPTAYVPIECDGGWRRARFCNTGAMADIWIPVSDVEPNMVSGVAVFKFQDNCYYFKESDPKLVGHGTSLTGSDVTWYTDCDACNNSITHIDCIIALPSTTTDVFPPPYSGPGSSARFMGALGPGTYYARYDGGSMRYGHGVGDENWRAQGTGLNGFTLVDENDSLITNLPGHVGGFTSEAALFAAAFADGAVQFDLAGDTQIFLKFSDAELLGNQGGSRGTPRFKICKNPGTLVIGGGTAVCPDPAAFTCSTSYTITVTDPSGTYGGSYTVVWDPGAVQWSWVNPSMADPTQLASIDLQCFVFSPGVIKFGIGLRSFGGGASFWYSPPVSVGSCPPAASYDNEYNVSPPHVPDNVALS